MVHGAPLQDTFAFDAMAMRVLNAKQLAQPLGARCEHRVAYFDHLDVTPLLQ